MPRNLRSTMENDIPWSEYIPHEPYREQLAFLMLPQREAMYGGQAGGGKSDALLMGALQYVDVPNYSAIIFRRQLTDLAKKEGLLNRALEWSRGVAGLPSWYSLGVKYNAALHSFVWPNGATLEFGYMGEFRTTDRYQGAAYQYIGWDEATQQYPEDYKYMWSRCRRRRCPYHGGRTVEGVLSPMPYDHQCQSCREYAALENVPLRIRVATNPGGASHNFFKRRFSIELDDQSGLWIGMDPSKPFIPANYEDNPYLDHKSYSRNLDELDPVTRAQLKHGDWGRRADSLYNPEWFPRYTRQADYLNLWNLDGSAFQVYHLNQLHIFSTCDFAASVKTGTAEHTYHKDYLPSWSVIATWGMTPCGRILLLDVARLQSSAGEVLSRAREVAVTWKPQRMVMETNGPGLPIAQLAHDMGILVLPVHQVMDKIARASAALTRSSQYQQIYFPHEKMNYPWLEDWEEEIFNWTGHPREPDDQIDCLSEAALHITTSLLADGLSPPEMPGSLETSLEHLSYQDTLAPDLGPYHLESHYV